MGDGFVKIYGDKLLNSTLHLEDPEVRLVFIYMLTLADRNGLVDLPSVKVLAGRLNLSVAYVQKALKVLTSPDADSRSKAHEGRRILTLDIGWQCVNYEHYRGFRTSSQVSNAKRQQKYRDQNRDVKGGALLVTEVTSPSASASASQEDAGGDLPLIAVIRQSLDLGYTKRFETLYGGVPAKSHTYQRHLGVVAQWVLATADSTGGRPEQITNKLLSGFFAATKPRDRRHSMSWLATDPLEYLPGGPGGSQGLSAEERMQRDNEAAERLRKAHRGSGEES